MDEMDWCGCNHYIVCMLLYTMIWYSQIGGRKCGKEVISTY